MTDERWEARQRWRAEEERRYDAYVEEKLIKEYETVMNEEIEDLRMQVEMLLARVELLETSYGISLPTRPLIKDAQQAMNEQLNKSLSASIHQTQLNIKNAFNI